MGLHNLHLLNLPEEPNENQNQNYQRPDDHVDGLQRIGPSIVKSIKLTVRSAEDSFDKLTDYVDYNGTYYDDEGYEPGGAYLSPIRGSRIEGEIDPETGEEITEIRRTYVAIQEAKMGDELSFLCSYNRFVCENFKYMERTFMIVSKNGGTIDDTLTFIHDFVDEDYNTVFKLTATAPRDAVDVYNLPWKVVENISGEEIDDELIGDQLYQIFIDDGFNYLYNKTGVKLKHLGIKRTTA